MGLYLRICKVANQKNERFAQIVPLKLFFLNSQIYSYRVKLTPFGLTLRIHYLLPCRYIIINTAKHFRNTPVPASIDKITLVHFAETFELAHIFPYKG